MTNAIAELTITSTNNPVFMMKDLHVMYQQRLKKLNASPEQIERVNVTRLEEHILKEVKGLLEEKKGRCTMLMIDRSLGRAVFKASQNSTVDEGVILSKAAGIFSKNLFSQDQSFDGNLASEPKKFVTNAFTSSFSSNLRRL